MDLRTHYDSYCKSLRRDLFEETAVFSKITKTKDTRKYKTIHQYLADLVKNIMAAIKQGDLGTYKKYLQQHQYAMTELLMRMVDEMMEDVEHSDLNYFYLARDLGWNWLKMSRVKYFKGGQFGLGDILLVPRYRPETICSLLPETKYVDADEAKQFLAMSDADRAKFLDVKSSLIHTSKYVGTYADVPMFVPIDDVNCVERGILDWTLSLERSYE